uniref:Uncharacterized protein n=1 Tax=Arion vulgaris TaxID=1028688 RepID=A0A0B6ZFW4_9EUPU
MQMGNSLQRQMYLKTEGFTLGSNPSLRDLPHHLVVRIVTETVTPVSDFTVIDGAAAYLSSNKAL